MVLEIVVSTLYFTTYELVREHKSFKRQRQSTFIYKLHDKQFELRHSLAFQRTAVAGRDEDPVFAKNRILIPDCRVQTCCCCCCRGST